MTPIRCKICASPSLTRLFFAGVDERDTGTWYACENCGSESSSNVYADVRHVYDANYVFVHGEDSASPDRLEEQVSSNCAWFDHHALPDLAKDFLDIGCCDGAALRVMAKAGWSVHGFDVVAPPYTGSHVTVRPYFHRWWFPIRYGAILAREVIEHVDSPALFLQECHGAIVPGGLLQVQTPKPSREFHPSVYQKAHLVILSPAALRKLLVEALFEVIEAREWGEDGRQPGQAFLCRARG